LWRRRYTFTSLKTIIKVQIAYNGEQAVSMSVERKLRFRIKRGEREVELEGDYEYVREKFEELLKEATDQALTMSQPQPQPHPAAPAQTVGLEGLVEKAPDGKPRLTIPVDSITAKEAVALMLIAVHPTPLSDEDLSNLLSSSWKTTKPEAVRARASELRRDGKLIAEKGAYSLSGAGVQWVQTEVIGRVRGRKA
jgi:hypothetical protein